MVVEISEDDVYNRIISFEKNPIYISGLPFVGKTTVIKRIKGNFELIELPKEVKSLDELKKYKQIIEDKVKSGKKVVVEGRNYVIDLMLGKVKPASEPSLRNPRTKISGNALTYHFDDLKVEKNIKDIVKFLEYALIVTPTYTTYIPKLFDEAQRMEGLDEVLPIVSRFKQLFAVFPKSDVKGDEAIIYPLVSLFNSPEEMKFCWSKLSDTWKELIYYAIDSHLRLLPGKSKEVINNYLSKIGEKEVKLSINLDYTPENLEIVEYLVAQLLNGKKVAITGPLKSRKTRIGREVMTYIKGKKDLKVIDYHDENGYKSLREIYKSLNADLYILTDDLLDALKDKLRVDMVTISPYQTFLSEKDYTDYIYNVIFEGDPNVLKWYSPLLAMKSFPIPVEISKLILKYFGRKVEEIRDDPILNWFSVIDYIPEDIKKAEGAEDVENYEKRADEILPYLINILKEKIIKENFAYNFFQILGHLLDKYKFSNIEDSPLNNYLINISDKLGMAKPLIKALIPIIKDYLNDGCSELIEPITLDPSAFINALPEIFSLNLHLTELYPKIIGTIVKSNDVKCVDRALQLVFNYALFNDRRFFVSIEDIIFNKIVELKSEDLVSRYVTMVLLTEYRNVKHIREIQKVIPNARPYTLILLPKETGRSPIEMLSSVLSLNYELNLAVHRSELDKVINKYDEYKRRLDQLKSVVKRIDDRSAKKILSTILFNGNLKDLINTLENDYYKFILYVRYASYISFRAFVKDRWFTDKNMLRSFIQSMLKDSEARYGYIKNLKELGDEEIKELIMIYQFKLADALLSKNKYEYKGVLEDILEIDEMPEEIKVLASLALGREINIESDDPLINIALSVIKGSPNEGLKKIYEEFKAEDYKLLPPDVVEAMLVYKMLSGQDISSDIESIAKTLQGLFFIIAHDFIKGDKGRYIASLILFYLP